LECKSSWSSNMSKNRLSFFFIFLLLFSGADLWAIEDPSMLRESSSFDESLFYKKISFGQDPMAWYRDNQLRLPLVSSREQSIRLGRMEQDILDWSDRKLQSLLPTPEYADFFSSIENLNKNWTFQTLGGEVLFDDAGDPLLLSAESDDIKRDVEAWALDADIFAQNLLERWSNSADTILGSILTGIPDDYKGVVEDKLKVSLEEYCNLVQKESDRLICWSSSKMNYLRSEDNYSLRHKSEEQSAAGIADSLIAGIRDELEETEEALHSGMDELQTVSLAEGLSAGSEEWESLFRREFQRGLDKWGDAEENFLAERLSWELRAEKEFLESEESWNEAFNLFASQRENWISSITLQMEQGLLFWKEQEESYMAEFHNIAEEMEKAALDQERKFAAQIESAISMYSDSYSLLNSAEENLSYYQNKLKYSRDEKALYQKEYDIWQDLRLSLINQMEEAREMLFNLEAVASGYDESVASGALERDLQEMRSRADRLYVQWEISEAVVLYALTDSSLRDTEAETAAKYWQAESDLELTEIDYSDAIQSLSKLRVSLAAEQLDIDEIRKNLDLAESEMMEAERIYENSRAVSLNDDPQVIEKMIEDLEQRLDIWFRGDVENTADRDMLFLEFIQSGEWERRNEYHEEQLSLLRDLKGIELPQEIDNFNDQQDLESDLLSLNELRALNPDIGLEDSILDMEKEMDLLAELEWNTYVQKNLLSFAGSADTKSELEMNILAAEYALLIDKVTALKDILISLKDREPEDAAIRGKYLDFLEKQGFNSGPEDISSVSTLCNDLVEMKISGYSRQDLIDQLDTEVLLWLYAVNSENDLLPGSEYLDLLVSERKIELLKAEAELAAFESMSVWCASYQLLADDGVLAADSGEEFVENLGSFDNLDSLIDWYHPLLQQAVFPEYLEKGLNAYILQHYGEELEAIDQVSDISAEDLDSRNHLLFRLRVLQEEEQSSSLKDMSFIDSILIKSFDAVHSDSISIPLRPSSSYLGSFYENEIMMSSYQKNIEKMRSDLELRLEDEEQYQIQILDPDRKLYFTKKTEYEDLMQELKAELSSFDSIQSLFLQKQQSVLDFYQRFIEASSLFQQAKEIMDYAGGAYKSGSYNVFTIRDERRAEYEKCDEALSILEHLDSIKESSITADDSWLELLENGNNLLSVSNNISFARQELIKELGGLNRQHENTFHSLIENSTDLINFSFRDGLSFTYNSTVMKQGMSTLTSWKNSNYNQYLDSYFSQADSSEVFTKDLLLWLGQIAGYAKPEEILKQFSYAYYHELNEMEGMDLESIKSDYTIDLLNDARHTDLINSEGNYLKSVHIGYRGNLDRFEDGGYESVYSGIVSSEGEYLKVFIDGEEWLQDKTASYLNRIKKNSTLNKQYAFYKMLMFSDAFKTNSLKHAMEKDLSMMAWKYIDDIAESEQKRFRWPWGAYRKNGRDIRDKRDVLKDSIGAYNGIRGRSSVADFSKDSISLLKKFRNIEKRISILSPAVINSEEEVQKLLYNISGITLSEEQNKLSSDAFSTLSSFDKSSALHLLDGLLEAFSIMTDQNNSSRQQREEVLRVEQLKQKFMLTEIFESSEWDDDQYKEAAKELYCNNLYSAEEYGLESIDSILAADNPYSRESFYTLESYGKQLIQNFHHRLSVVKEDPYGKLRDGLENQYRQKEYWENLSREIGQEGLNQWALSLKKLIAQRNSWHSQINTEYERKNFLWEDKYHSLIERKNSWVQHSSRNVLEYGAQTFAREWDLESNRLMADLNFQLISDLFIDSAPAVDLVSDALQGRTLDKLLNSVGNLSLRVSGTLFNPANIALIPDQQSASFQIESSHRKLTEKVYKAMAYSQACQMRELVTQVESSISDNLDDANSSVDESVEAQLGDAGYVRQGNYYFRTVLIDSSLAGGNESEKQNMEGYRFFKAPSFDHQVDLNSEHLILLNSEMIQASVDLAQERLGRYINLVFGNEEDGNLRVGLDQNFISLLEQAEKNYSGSAQFHDDNNSEKRGLFNFYLGYAPEMNEDSPEEVETSGYGEFGRIYKNFFIQQARLFRGLASVNSPWYSQKIWDDDSDNDGESDNLLGAPSVRSLTDIALNVVGNIFMPGVGSLLLNLVDNALFTMMDFGNGIVDMGQASLGFLKNAAGSFLNFGAGALGGIADNLGFLQNSGLFEVASDVGIRGISSVASNYGTAALYSLDADSKGWNWNTFNSMTSWENAGIGYLSGMTGTAVSGALNLGTFGFIGDIGKNADRFTSLIGGLSASGLEYAVSGETTLNLLNMGKSGTGFFEMNLGGGGSLFNFGTRGTDVSLGSLSSAVKGLSHFSENLNINAVVKDKELRAGMRTLRSSGIDDTESLYQDILNGNVSLSLSEGQNYQGYTSVDESGKRVIDLNRDGQSSLDLAVLLSHEAFRDGLHSGNAAQILETVEAASAHMAVGSALQQRYGSFSLNGDNNQEAFAYRLFAQGVISKGEMTDYIKNSYDSSGDFWKRLDDGRIVQDGFAGLYDEMGNLIRVATDDAGNQLGEMESLQHYIDSGTADYLSYLSPEQRSVIKYTRSSEDVNRQVNMRDKIISEYEVLNYLSSSGVLCDSGYQKAMDGVFHSMAEYNNEYVLKGIALTPEGVITQRFADSADRMKTQKDGETQYLSYTHPGIDTAEGLGVYSPGFTIPGSDVKNYAFGMNLIGMENNYLLEHMNPVDINNLLLQELTYPGQKLMDFPELMFPKTGGGTGSHAHIELSSYNPDTKSWGFSDPVGDWSDWSSGDKFSGYYEKIKIGNDGEDIWKRNILASWDYWEPWK
jgi:hypothetical protein